MATKKSAEVAPAWVAHPRFALAEGRDDLAEAAIARQLDFEAQAEKLKAAEAEAGQDTCRLEEGLAALATRKSQMEEALASFETAQRQAACEPGGARQSDRRPSAAWNAPKPHSTAPWPASAA